MQKGRVLSNLLWKLGERGTVQIVQFVAQLLLARILTPNDYGILAIVLVFINLANVFVQSGLSTALIQKKEITKEETSTVFFASLGIAVMSVIFIWFMAPYVATFYDDSRIVEYLRVASFVLIVGAFNSIQVALISRELQFKKNFYSSLGGIIVATVVSIIMALNGFGVWSLIANYAVNIVVTSIILYVVNPWLPRFAFSYSKFKPLFNYGSKLLGADLISVLFTNLYSLIIGKLYSKIWLGYFENGNRIPSSASNALTTAVQSVLLPVMSVSQDNPSRLKQMMRRSVQVNSLMLFPLMFLLCACAQPIVLLLLTEKWLMAVPFLQLSAVLYAFYPIHITNLQAINALGRSDVFMYCEIKKKFTELLILAIAIWFNIYLIAVGRVVASIIALYINMKPNKKYLSYGLREQAKDFAPALIIALGSAVVVYPISFIIVQPIIALPIQIIAGLTIYVLSTYRWNKEPLVYLLSKFNLTMKTIDLK